MSRIIVARSDVSATTFHGIITAAEEMRAFLRLLERAARSEATVLIQGETGTGKHLVARALHELGPRASRPYGAVRCAALTHELLEAEIVGYLRGASSAAARDRPGLLARVDGGTVFLDEVAAAPPDVQARLLQLLEERCFVPLGALEPVSVDVRVIGATTRTLGELAQKGAFRAELMYRLRVVSLHVPPLRERTGDVAALTWHFIDLFNAQGLRRVEAIDDAAFETLRANPWPGNVRELRNAIEHAYAVGDGPLLTRDDLPAEVRGEVLDYGLEGNGTPNGGAEPERIAEALRRTRGRKAAAADLLGMSRSTLWRKMREYGM